MTLVAGQIIKRYGDPRLWRVEYANECRARVVPLSKQHVKMPDGREFDASYGAENIASSATVEIVDDVERARDELELAQTERELAELRRALNAPEQPVPPAPAPTRPVKREPVKPGGGWYMVDPGDFKDGSLAETVMTYIIAFPGKSTSDIVAGVKAAGAVAACVSRFHQAGLIVKK